MGFNNPHVDPYGISYVAPGDGGAVIVPSDSAEFFRVARGVKVTAAGTVAFVTEDGSSLAVPFLAGETIPWRVRKVLATGTTTAAGSLFALDAPRVAAAPVALFSTEFSEEFV